MTGRSRIIGGGTSRLESLPIGVLLEILQTLDLESLCTAACVSRTLSSSVSQILSSSFPILDLSFFSPDAVTLNDIQGQISGYKSLSLDCLRLDNSTINSSLGPQIQELNLFKCSEIPDEIFTSVGQNCPDVRALMVEVGRFEISGYNLACMLNNLSSLESLSIKIRWTDYAQYRVPFTKHSLPKTIKVLKLKPIYNEDAIHVIRNIKMPFPIGSPPFPLLSLSLLVDIIDDKLIILITSSLTHLVKLDLEDAPDIEPHQAEDLTNHGLQSLGMLHNLSSLSLVRHKTHLPVYFKRINDMGMFLLSESCKGLRSISLGGFSKVSDAGFSSILHSCRNLETFKVQNSPRLSDLTFHNIAGSTSCSLVNVKLSSSGLVTSDTVIELSFCLKLETLNFSGCKSIADGCLNSISSLIFLTTLNLEGADVTDSGMGIIGRGFSPIANICLRGCKRISDKGISLLLSSGGTISKTLTSLDIGYISGISDDSLSTIAAFALNITELSIRYCFSVTGTALEELGSEKRYADGRKMIRWLDMYNCIGLCVESLESVKKPLFRGLQWLGVGSTSWESKRNKRRNELIRIRQERPWLTLCLKGCEMGCNDGWQFHKFYDF